MKSKENFNIHHTIRNKLQYIQRNMHMVFALLCFVVVIHWLIFPYPSGLLHWHCGNLTIAPVPAKQPWWIWINTPCEFIMNDCISTIKQSTTKPCAYFLGYTVSELLHQSDLPCWYINNYLWYMWHICNVKHKDKFPCLWKLARSCKELCLYAHPTHKIY